MKAECDQRWTRSMAAVILAGGKNSRMKGQKKLFLRYDGETFLHILVRRLSGIGQIYLSVEAETPYQDCVSVDEINDLIETNKTSKDNRINKIRSDHAVNHTSHLQLVADLYPGIGPIGGIASALSACEEEALFVVACDMPFLQEKTIDRICRAYREHPGQITIAESSGRLHPLCGIYPKAALPVLQEQISKGDYRMMNAIRSFGVNIVTMEEDDPSFKNINTVSEYKELLGNGII